MRINSIIKNVYIAFFALLACVAMVAAAYFAITYDNRNVRQPLDEDEYSIALTNGYREKLYESIDCIKNIESNLGKVTVSTDKTMQSQLLGKVAVEAGNLSADVSSLPVQTGDSLFQVEKFCNQLQYYSISLIQRISAGNKLDGKDVATVNGVRETALNLKKFFERALDNDNEVLSEGLSDISSVLNDSFDNMEEVFTYEKLIYDGPFSDSMEKNVTVPVTVSYRDGLETAKKVFGGEVVFAGKSGDGQYLIYSVNDGQGRVLIAADGKVAEGELRSTSEGEAKVNSRQCIESAEKLCKNLGMDVSAIWVSKEQDNITYVNLAPVVNGIIVYPDIVKVAVDCVSGNPVGIEARSYVANHRDREGLTMADMPDNLSSDRDYEVISVKKALVEKNDKEYLCYQLECNKDGNQYFVYLDNGGHEVEIFKVVKGTEGYTVM